MEHVILISTPTGLKNKSNIINECKSVGGTWLDEHNECESGAEKCISVWQSCLDTKMCRSAVGGEFIGIETTSVLAAGAQYTAAWMIPVIVSAIGIGIVIARKF